MSQEASVHLAALVRHFRLTAGLNQEELAERTGLSVRTISDFERDLRTRPRLETIRMLADGLGLSASDRAALISAARPELRSNLATPSIEAPTNLGASPAELPRATGALIGRERERAELMSMLSSGASRLITLTGPGGVGKTRLAIAVARDVAPAFDGNVTFVALAPVRDASLVLPTIARALGVRESGGRPLIDHVCGFLASRPALLVLDNMEQVLEAASDVADILAATADLHIMVTSRGALRLSGEHQYPVPALRLPAPGREQPLEEVGATAAVALFVERAHMAQPGFALTEANAPAVSEICHRLDGLPLAIELAAARTPVLPPAALLARMERRLPLLTGGPRDLPERLQTMRAAVAWSHDLLTPREHVAFRRLAVFDGGFTLEAAEQVMSLGGEDIRTADCLDLIAALVERGLLWQAEQPDGDARFGMLETVREFGLEQLDASGEEEDTRRAHAVCYLSLAEALASGDGQALFGLLDRIERELPNFRVALAWTEQSEDTRLGMRLAASLYPIWHIRSHRAEGRGWLERALTRDPGEPSVDRAAALLDLGHIEYNFGNAARGAAYINEGLELARALDHGRTIVIALALLLTNAVDVGDGEQAGKALAELQTWAEHPGDWFDYTGLVLLNHGLLARQRADSVSARRYFTDAIAESERQGEIYDRAIAVEMLGLVQCECGEYASAAANLLDSLHDWRAAGTRESLVDWLAIVATLAEAVGEPVRSCRWFGAVEAQAEVLGFNFPQYERNEFARTAARVRSGLTDEHWTAGRQLSLDRVTEEAAEWLRDLTISELQNAQPAPPG